ncbi:ATP-binding cassette domain-containing protein [candidate division KSB1 bacterium]|nr:ATP-binding cassette domain-containing protein [candidate division KSB1 bacterium]
METSETHTEYLVEVERVTAGFAGSIVLDDVSMNAHKHDITVILGASGCGKTTLLKNIIRLYQPRSGSIRLFGQEITTMDDPEFNRILEKIGVLFQNGALLNSIPISENVAIPIKQHTSLSPRLVERLVRIKLDLVGLQKAATQLPSQLSGGMRKRAALARSIALDPPLLFCDEPTAGLDPVTADSLDRLILNMRDQLGMTIVVVTHEISSIKRIADRIVFMDAGKILFTGSLDEARQAGIEQIDQFFGKAGD